MSIPISQLVTGVVNGEVEIPGTNPLDTTSSLNGTTFKYLVSDILQYILSAQGFTTYQSCIAASTTSLTATYDNGTAGVGATLTNAGAQVALTLDGVTLSVDDRVLIKNQSSTAENGIYVVTNIGSASTNWILTRATDYDQASEIVYLGIVLINQGTTQKGIIFQEMSQGPFVIGTSPITFQALSIDVSFLPSASPANKILISDGTYWVATTATYPATTAINQILYSSANNVIGEITTANSATLVTSSTGVPGYTGSMANGQLVIGSTGATPVVGSITGAGSITVTPGAGTIQISSSAGGVVNPGTANELAYYAATGSAVSGLATANNGVLITSSAGVPSISSTLPSTVQGNITSVGAIGSGTWQGNTIAVGYGGTGVTTIGANGTLAQSNGTTYSFTTATYPSVATSTNHLMRADGTNWVASTAAQLSATDALTGLTELQVDNININGNTIEATNVGGNITLIADGTGNVDIFAPPASEASGINVNGFVFNTAFRINDIGTVSPAQSIIHRHSTTLEPVLLFARANSDTDSHAAVTNGMALSSTYYSGWTGSQYSLFGQIRISADATGTISDTSAPGKLELMLSPDGAITPVTAMSIASNGNVSFAANIVAGAWQATAIGVSYGGTGLTSTPINGQLLIGNGTGYALSTLTAGAGISIANAAGSITISGTGSGIGWTEVTGASATMSADNGYVTNNAGLVALTLPTTAAFGAIINVQGKGAGGWKIAQNAGQIIHFGNVDTTTGVTGYLASTNRYDSIQLLCITADTDWAVMTTQGVVTYN